MFPLRLNLTGSIPFALINGAAAFPSICFRSSAYNLPEASRVIYGFFRYCAIAPERSIADDLFIFTVSGLSVIFSSSIKTLSLEFEMLEFVCGSKIFRPSFVILPLSVLKSLTISASSFPLETLRLLSFVAALRFATPSLIFDTAFFSSPVILASRKSVPEFRL